MILKDKKIEFEDFDPLDYVQNPMRTQKFHTICKLNIPKIELVFPEDKRDFEYTLITLAIRQIKIFFQKLCTNQDTKIWIII